MESRPPGGRQACPVSAVYGAGEPDGGNPAGDADAGGDQGDPRTATRCDSETTPHSGRPPGPPSHRALAVGGAPSTMGACRAGERDARDARACPWGGGPGMGSRPPRCLSKGVGTGFFRRFGAERLVKR